MTNPTRKAEVLIVRNVYDCYVGESHYICYGAYNQGSTVLPICCDCNG